MQCYICGRWPLPPLAVVTWVDDLGQVEPHPPGTVMHEPSTPLWIWCDRWERNPDRQAIGSWARYLG
jgi:hypothetical protein